MKNLTIKELIEAGIEAGKTRGTVNGRELVIIRRLLEEVKGLVDNDTVQANINSLIENKKIASEQKQYDKVGDLSYNITKLEEVQRYQNMNIDETDENVAMILNLRKTLSVYGDRNEYTPATTRAIALVSRKLEEASMILSETKVTKLDKDESNK